MTYGMIGKVQTTGSETSLGIFLIKGQNYREMKI